MTNRSMKTALLVLSFAFALVLGSVAKAGTLRVSHGLSDDHPINIGLLEFKRVVEAKLPGKFEIEVYPNALLGPTAKALELMQVGAIDFVSGNTANFETFDTTYQIFSIPYLFNSVENYHKIMNTPEIVDPIFKSTRSVGFEAIGWFDASSRNLYGKSPIIVPDDIKGKKFRVQPNPTNIKMMAALGASGVPMSFGEVYTALQQGVIDGGENNEVCLVVNKHGEICKHWSYTRQQMMPDMLAVNSELWASLTPEEKAAFEEALAECMRVFTIEWNNYVENIKKYNAPRN